MSAGGSPPRRPARSAPEQAPAQSPSPVIGPQAAAVIEAAAKAPNGEWKLVVGVLLCVLAAAGAWLKLLSVVHLAGMFYAGVALIALGIRSRQTRVEKQTQTIEAALEQSQAVLVMIRDLLEERAAATAAGACPVCGRRDAPKGKP